MTTTTKAKGRKPARRKPWGRGERRSIAYHESGHAVVGEELGFSVKAVTLAPADPKHRGTCTWSCIPVISPEQRVAVLAAGFLSCRLADVPWSKAVRGISSDVCDVAAVAGFAVAVDEKGRGTSLQTILTGMALAASILSRRWAAVVNIAELLLKRTTIDGPTVRRSLATFK